MTEVLKNGWMNPASQSDVIGRNSSRQPFLVPVATPAVPVAAAPRTIPLWLCVHLPALPVDVFLASHASQFGMHGKYKPGDTYDPNRFVDPQGYRAAVERLEGIYREQLARERAGR